jgi:hypothetical protein
MEGLPDIWIPIPFFERSVVLASKLSPWKENRKELFWGVRFSRLFSGPYLPLKMNPQ